MELDPVEVRILGCLAEKAVTTPDNYPLSTNALVNACNQTSNRDPVMDVTDREVDQAMLSLRTQGLARTVTGGRANKHRHVLDEAWGLDAAAIAVLGVLFLRGAQTPGELRGRTERMHEFGEVDAVESVLRELAARPEPLVEQLDRMPGQKERRWVHRCGPDGGEAGGDPVSAAPGETSPPTPSPTPSLAPSAPSPVTSPIDRPAGEEVAELRRELHRLRRDVDRLYDLLGETRDGA